MPPFNSCTHALKILNITALSASVLSFTSCKPALKPLDLSAEEVSDGSARTVEDPAVVFRKAFWRHPGEGDQILHAERREWSTSDGVSRWQWFIAVRPGPAMDDWLADNPFGLAPPAGNPVTGGGGSPFWFPDLPRNLPVMVKQGSAFTMFYSADGKTLYATDTGYGFTGGHVSSGS